jgi:chaperonin GroEL
MAKQVLFDEDVKKLLIKGVNTVADAVRVTVGPRGRNVILDKGFGSPTITNDGVSIAKEISLENRFEHMGAEIIKEVATKTNDMAGDGTTTSVIVAQALINEGFRHTAIGANSMAIKSAIEHAGKDAVDFIKKSATPIKDKNQIIHVATISAESKELGRIIADTIEKVGKDGVVTVEESQSFGVTSEVAQGFEFNQGYISPYMITDSERMNAEYKDPLILVTDKKISNIKELLPLIESLAKAGKKELVIIADDVEGEALTTFVVNKIRGIFSVLAIKAPGFGDRKKEELKDIAITTGATVISDDFGITLEKATLSMLGKAHKIISKKDSTVIVDGKGSKKELDARISQIKSQIKSIDSKYEKEKLEERVAKLSGGVAVIKVGAATETEMKYLKLKIEDAVNATKSAVDEGVVAGGGSTLAKTAAHLEQKVSKNESKMSSEEKIGYEIVSKALKSPLRQIAYNAGKEDPGVIIDTVIKGSKNAGYDALQDKMVEDMIVSGIIDPVKVTRNAVSNAMSAAAILLTTEVAIADIPEKKDQHAGHNHGMGEY